VGIKPILPFSPPSFLELSMTMDIGISDPARKEVALGLCRLLADASALYLKPTASTGT
jgi:hypothetical protein